MLSMRLATFLISLGLVATLRAASPTPPEDPAATLVPARKHSLKDTVPVKSLGDSVVARRTGFEVVPGKDPNGWSFIVEPYLWGLGIDGTVGVKGLDTHIDYNPLTIVKHLDWGIMAEGEVRMGKWGILGDGFFAQLSASGDSPGPLYDNAHIKLQQGMVRWRPLGIGPSTRPYSFLPFCCHRVPHRFDRLCTHNAGPAAARARYSFGGEPFRSNDYVFGRPLLGSADFSTLPRHGALTRGQSRNRMMVES